MTVQAQVQGQSTYTPEKEDVFEHILSQHMHIVQAIFDKRPWGHTTYHYFDIYAGAGFNDQVGCWGSPMVFWSVASRFKYAHEATFIESNEANAMALAKRAEAHKSSIVLCGDNATALPGAVSGLRSAWSFGLIYADPNACPPFDLLAQVSRLPTCEHLDILIHAPTTTIKRVRCAYDRPDLLASLATIAKKHWLIRDADGTGKQQWTFLLGTNWQDFPGYKKVAFYPVASAEGKRILEELNYTKEERQQARQPTLLSYDTYEEYLRTPEFRAVRAQVMARAQGVCERCGRRQATEPHHLRYPKWGTLDVPENMIAVCHECHCELHGKEN